MATARSFPRLGTSERRLALAALLVASVLAATAVLGGLESWQYYLTVEECLAGGPSLVGKRVRVHGTITGGSLRILDRGTRAEFLLDGPDQDLAVDCRGPLPDNLADEIQVVVEGTPREAGSLHGDRVMTRCASKYEARPARGIVAIPTGPDGAPQ